MPSTHPPASPPRAAVDRRPRWKRRLDRLARDPYGVLMDVIGDHTVGGTSLPTDWRSNQIRESGDTSYLWIATDNDAFGVRVTRHYKDEPRDALPSDWTNLNRAEARAVAWWILRWWAAEWFGLRRALYYWALHRHLEATRVAR